MISKLYKAIAALIVVVAAAIGLYLKGRNAGKVSEQVKQQKAELEAERSRDEAIATREKINAAIERMPASDVQQRLRDKYSRD